jgi:hypothetical protein
MRLRAHQVGVRDQMAARWGTGEQVDADYRHTATSGARDPAPIIAGEHGTVGASGPGDWHPVVEPAGCLTCGR